jgi:uncharacterized membrane protein
MLAGINWLEAHTDQSEAILASYITSNMLPGRSGNKVFLGDWTHTVNLGEKRQQVKWFFQTTSDEQQRCAFLYENGIRYVFRGPFEEKLDMSDFDGISYLQPKYQNPSVTIYEVVGDRLGCY